MTQAEAERAQALRMEAFAEHLRFPRHRSEMPAGGHTGAAGGAPCGDLIVISLSLDRADADGRVDAAGFEASGCGAAIAAGSAAVSILEGKSLLQAARIGAAEISSQLGGLSAGKFHAAELAADALHRALGLAAGSAALPPAKGRILVAMSGGVDSAVAALLSAEQGSETVGVTLELWADAGNDESRSCCSALAQRTARALAHEIGIPHFSIDMRRQFRAGVVARWLEGHAEGMTPNPCVRCNGEVRLDGMLKLAESLGAEALVTGHYARLAWEELDNGESGALEASRGGVGFGVGRAVRSTASCGAFGAAPEVTAEHDAANPARGGGAPRLPLLMVALDEGKDQSYALAALPRSSLARMRFPLGALRKDEVRKIAEQAGLTVARRPDSQDLCFLAGTGKKAFLRRHGVAGRSGAIIDEQGRRLGEHAGAELYTVGQRHGLRIGGGQPLYVLSTDVAANTVTVGARERLLSGEMELCDAVLHCDAAAVDSLKIRYRGSRIRCTLAGAHRSGPHERLTIRLGERAERTAAGQLACLYSGELLVGYGTIMR